MILETLDFEKCLDRIRNPQKLKKKDYLKQGQFPVVSQESSLINGYCDNPEMLFEITKPIIAFGDHTQCLKYIDFNFVMGADGLKILQPIDRLNPKYFLYFLTLSMPKSRGYARHYSLLKKISISFPSLAEQQRIVAKLDKTFEEIDKVTNLLEVKKDEVEKIKISFFRKLLSDEGNKWKIFKLNEISEFQNGLWKGKKGEKTKSKVLRNTNFTKSGQLNLSDVAELEVELAQLKNRKLVYGDIILEKSGGGDKTPVGRVCFFDINSHENFSFSNFTSRIKLKDSKTLDPLYFFWNLYFLYISGRTKKMQKHSTGIRNLKLEEYKEIKIKVPDMLSQKRIVAKLDKAFEEIDKTTNIINKSNENYKALKSSLLRQELQKESAA